MFVDCSLPIVAAKAACSRVVDVDVSTSPSGATCYIRYVELVRKPQYPVMLMCYGHAFSLPLNDGVLRSGILWVADCTCLWLLAILRSHSRPF
jgi:hypothetical protein